MQTPEPVAMAGMQFWLSVMAVHSHTAGGILKARPNGRSNGWNPQSSKRRGEMTKIPCEGLDSRHLPALGLRQQPRALRAPRIHRLLEAQHCCIVSLFLQMAGLLCEGTPRCLRTKANVARIC